MLRSAAARTSLPAPAPPRSPKSEQRGQKPRGRARRSAQATSASSRTVAGGRARSAARVDPRCARSAVRGLRALATFASVSWRAVTAVAALLLALADDTPVATTARQGAVHCLHGPLVSAAVPHHDTNAAGDVASVGPGTRSARRARCKTLRLGRIASVCTTILRRALGAATSAVAAAGRRKRVTATRGRFAFGALVRIRALVRQASAHARASPYANAGGARRDRRAIRHQAAGARGPSRITAFALT
jgi:hypothetical protein